MQSTARFARGGRKACGAGHLARASVADSTFRLTKSTPEAGRASGTFAGTDGFIFCRGVSCGLLVGASSGGCLHAVLPAGFPRRKFLGGAAGLGRGGAETRRSG